MNALKNAFSVAALVAVAAAYLVYKALTGQHPFECLDDCLDGRGEEP